MASIVAGGSGSSRRGTGSRGSGNRGSGSRIPLMRMKQRLNLDFPKILIIEKLHLVYYALLVENWGNQSTILRFIYLEVFQDKA